MNITLYKNVSEKNKLNKTLNSALNLEGNLREESNVVNPSILIETTNPTNYNYFYVEQFKRYYYITEIESIRRNIWRISGKCDTLQSFKSEIIKNKGIIEKQKAQTNNLFDDGSYINQCDIFQEVSTFADGFDDFGHFVLITAGAIQ